MNYSHFEFGKQGRKPGVNIGLGFLLTLSLMPTAHAAVQEAVQKKIQLALRENQSLPGGASLKLMADTRVPVTAEIEYLKLDTGCTDAWCGGTIKVAGETLVIPRNLQIDLPANRLTLKQLVDQAPTTCRTRGETGLARQDTCLAGGKGATAVIHANRSDCGTAIVGDLFVQLGPESMTGAVSFINHAEGYFRLNGQVGSDTTGTLVRINDPTGRYTIQKGKGCAGGPNCSPDPRFTADPDNYTVSFLSGYPMCIASMVTTGSRPRGSDANGNGDAFCPTTNRVGSVASDSRRFAPLKVGDNVSATGSFVYVAKTRFLTAHTVTVNRGITTKNLPDQPDYIALTAADWGLPRFSTAAVEVSFGGRTTLPESQLDIFALRVDPTDNSNHQEALASTVGNPHTTELGIGGPGGIWSIGYALDFAFGAPVDPLTSPCAHLRNAGFNVCPMNGTMKEEFSFVSPPPREILAVSRHRLNVGVVALDINANAAPSGRYTMPLGLGLGGLTLPDPTAFDFDEAAEAFVFDGLPWSHDRRLSPGGCLDSGCEQGAQALTPYPISGLDPRGSDLLIPTPDPSRVLAYFTYVGESATAHFLSWPPINSCSLPVGNVAPVANPDTATTRLNTAVRIAVLNNDRDSDGTITLSGVSVVVAPAHGTAVVNADGTVTYTPATGYVGVDSFQYRATDNRGTQSNAASVSLTITSVVLAAQRTE